MDKPNTTVPIEYLDLQFAMAYLCLIISFFVLLLGFGLAHGKIMSIDMEINREIKNNKEKKGKESNNDIIKRIKKNFKFDSTATSFYLSLGFGLFFCIVAIILFLTSKIPFKANKFSLDVA